MITPGLERGLRQPRRAARDLDPRPDRGQDRDNRSDDADDPPIQEPPPRVRRETAGPTGRFSDTSSGIVSTSTFHDSDSGMTRSTAVRICFSVRSAIKRRSSREGSRSSVSDVGVVIKAARHVDEDAAPFASMFAVLARQALQSAGSHSPEPKPARPAMASWSRAWAQAPAPAA